MESRKNGTDEPVFRAAMETQTEKRLVDIVGEGDGGQIESVALKPMYYHM